VVREIKPLNLGIRRKVGRPKRQWLPPDKKAIYPEQSGDRRGFMANRGYKAPNFPKHREGGKDENRVDCGVGFGRSCGPFLFCRGADRPDLRHKRRYDVSVRFSSAATNPDVWWIRVARAS